MKSLYSSPLRVYLCLGFLALIGVYCGFQLPISLFPNSTKPEVAVVFNTGSITGNEFLNTYGHNFESRLKEISSSGLEVEKLTASYASSDVRYVVRFKWGAAPREAYKEVLLVATSFAGQLPQEIRDSLNVWSQNENQGFLAISFYSKTRSLDDLFNYLEPLITPMSSKATDAQYVELYNPSQKQIQIQLYPEKMAAFLLAPKDVSSAVFSALGGGSGGSVTVGLNTLGITMPRSVINVEDLGAVMIATPSGRTVRLSNIAHIDLGVPMGSDRSFKTSGAPSLILFAEPRLGGNVKRMAEQLIDMVKKLQPSFPSDIEYKILVDPSEFIRSAIKNVLHEVALAAFLAVCVLFLFIGNVKNVITAAIEIPMSIVLAFILMKLAHINLNLISLGGLALSAGMNVDGSVVVMENIFRHFEEAKKNLTPSEKLHILVEAVKEVKLPVIASTMASLVVFLPLALTSDLSNAILGDLALAVVFSHGFSAIVALVLVPTVRLQMMSFGGDSSTHSPIEGLLRKMERGYSFALNKFMSWHWLKISTYTALTVALVILATTVLPKLPKEIIGLPDTDWIIVNINTLGNTFVKQMESQSEEIEARIIAKYGDSIQYTFTQVRGANNSQVMARLKNKEDMQILWKDFEKTFANTPSVFFYVRPWNPSELPIPNPPQMRLTVRGGDDAKRLRVGRIIKDLLDEKKLFPRLNQTPNIARGEDIILKPQIDQLSLLQKAGMRWGIDDLSDISRVATDGRRIGFLPIEGRLISVFLSYTPNIIKSAEDLAAFPIGAGGKLIPLKALATVKLEPATPGTYREDEQELILLEGRVNKGDEKDGPALKEKTREIIENWKSHDRPKGTETISVNIEDAEKDLTEALHQLAIAIGLSILLIFITMVLQFGSVSNALLVLVAIPLGFIGVLVSLAVFKSTLSLNSALGVILLNGIAVANSILLVDFLTRGVAQGLSPKAAALNAAHKRVRPILMTSLTTGLGMLPIALGLGEGGHILQPLGLAVIGGLGFSLLTTLFVVPSLQVSFLEWRGNRR